MAGGTFVLCAACGAGNSADGGGESGGSLRFEIEPVTSAGGCAGAGAGAAGGARLMAAGGAAGFSGGMSMVFDPGAGAGDTGCAGALATGTAMDGAGAN